MPRGVTDQFLGLLRREKRASLRTVCVMAALAVAAYFMAELTDAPLLGLVVWLGVAALALGVGLGLLVGRWESGRHEASLRAAWASWMRMSLSATRLRDVARGVAQKTPALHVQSLAWGLLTLANGVLFVALWLDQPWALAYGGAVAVANGMSLGAVAGHAAWTWRWTSEFSRTLDGMIAEGQVGLWGEV